MNTINALLDAGLKNRTSTEVTSIARFLGGKQTRKEEALAYVRATMNDPDLVKAALARTTNNERLLLQLFKYFDGIVTGSRPDNSSMRAH